MPAGLRFLLAAALLYGGLWPLMNVAFIANRFPTPFLTGAAFFHWYSHVIGGPAEYTANLFSQTYSRHWAGALAFTLLALAAWAIARGVLRRFSPGSCNWPAAAFPLIALILASRYVAVSYILPMTAGLAAAWLYMALCDRLHDRRAQTAAKGLFLIASLPVYFLLGSGFLYLCAMCAFFEFVRKRPAWGVAWIAFGAAVPYGMSYAYYEPDIASRYFRWIAKPQFDLMTNCLIAAMYLFLPAGALAAVLSDKFRLGARMKPGFRRAVQIVGFAALVLLASRLVVLRLDKSGWDYANYLLDAGRPDEALAALARSADDSDPSRYRTFYALARTDRLLWEMFHYPQLPSSDALLFRDTKFDAIPGIGDWRSDVYLELGRVNDSQRWAHETLAARGETPRLLERMAQVYILNGNPEAARTFLRALETVPFQAARAQRYLTELDRDPGMRSDPLVARIQPLMLRKDYVGTWTTEQILQQCLEANSSNRIAFEYLMAHYLLTSDMEGFAVLAPHLKYYYRVLPTHVQEALLSFKNVNDSLPPGISESAISSEIESRFHNFIGLYLRYKNGPAERTWEALAPDFGGTYWFFYIFGRTAAGPPPQLHGATSQGAGRPQ